MKFKFKVWDKKKNTCIVDPKINTKGKYIGQTSEAGRFEVRPYIGIKDTNGKELYLNDDIHIDGLGAVRIVFQQAAFGFVIDNNFYSFAHEITTEWHMVEGCVQEIELLKNEASND